MNKSQQVREWFDTGVIDMSPDKKLWAATKLGMTIQTVHAALVRHTKTNNPTQPTVPSHTDYDIKNVIKGKVEDCLQMARQAGYRTPSIIDVRWDLRGKTAGQACHRFTGSYIRVNMVLARENREHYIAQTVPHEVAHIIDHYHNGRSSGHGRPWKRIMELAFRRPADRCHSYDTTNARVRTLRRYQYVCDCATPHNITSIKHRRIQLEGARYICKRCRGVLRLP